MRRLAPALLAAALVELAAACSSPEDAGAPTATAEEQRALAEARAMIPESELPPATATPAVTESATDDQ